MNQLTTQVRMLNPSEVDAIAHRVDLYLHGAHRPFEQLVDPGEGCDPQPQWLLDIADLLGSDEAAHERIDELIAEVRIATHTGPR